MPIALSSDLLVGNTPGFVFGYARLNADRDPFLVCLSLVFGHSRARSLSIHARRASSCARFASTSTR